MVFVCVVRAKKGAVRKVGGKIKYEPKCRTLVEELSQRGKFKPKGWGISCINICVPEAGQRAVLEKYV